MKAFFKARLRSFRYAFEGWGYLLRSQPNSWIHAVVTVLVIVLAFWLKLTARDWAILVLTIGIVWMAEFFNTAIEAVLNILNPEWHVLVKIGKDVGAAAVLVVALASVIIGILILGPPLWARLIAIFA